MSFVNLKKGSKIIKRSKSDYEANKNVWENKNGKWHLKEKFLLSNNQKSYNADLPKSDKIDFVISNQKLIEQKKFLVFDRGFVGPFI